MVQKGEQLSFLYKGSFADGEVFDDCAGEPHTIIYGRHQVMEALENALADMEINEERTLELSPDQAYGEYNEQAVQHFPAYMVPNGENLPVGQTIAWKTPRSAEPIPAKVVSIINQEVTLDFNHPLAGKDIVYWIKRV